MGNTNIYVDYNNGSPTIGQNGALGLQYSDTMTLLLRGFPGNDYQHASLLRPVASTAGSLGTAQMQTDAIIFLLSNLQ